MSTPTAVNIMEKVLDARETLDAGHALLVAHLREQGIDAWDDETAQRFRRLVEDMGVLHERIEDVGIDGGAE